MTKNLGFCNSKTALEHNNYEKWIRRKNQVKKGFKN